MVRASWCVIPARPPADYRDTVLLVVNVASQCGLTPQHEELQQVRAESPRQRRRPLPTPDDAHGSGDTTGDRDGAGVDAGITPGRSRDGG
jgi:hypothetical protein